MSSLSKFSHKKLIKKKFSHKNHHIWSTIGKEINFHRLYLEKKNLEIWILVIYVELFI